MNRRHVLAVSGLVLFACVVWVHFNIYQGEFYRFSDEELTEGAKEFVFWQIPKWQRPMIIAGLNIEQGVQYNKITLTFPNLLKQNHSRLVTLTYDKGVRKVVSNAGDVYDYRRPTLRTLSAGLTSAAFVVSPNNTIEKKEGEHLPTKFTWVITPERLGNHFLIFDLDELIESNAPPLPFPEVPFPEGPLLDHFPGLPDGPPDKVYLDIGDVSLYPVGYILLADPPYTLSVNGVEEVPGDWKNPMFPVTVVTYLGVSQRSFFYGQTLFGIIAFLLTLPYLRAFFLWIRNRLVALV